MAEEIQEAVQIIRVTYDGLEIAMKIGSGGLAAAQKALSTLVSLLEHEKTLGKTSMKKLLLRGGDLQVFQFDEKDFKKVQKLLKRYGVLYSVLPDLNKGDGKKEIIFPTEAVGRVNMIAKKLLSGRIGSYEEYLNNQAPNGQTTEEAIEKLSSDLLKQAGDFVTERQEVREAELRKHLEVSRDETVALLEQLEVIGVVKEKDTAGTYAVTMDKEAFEKKLESYTALTERAKVAEIAQQSDYLDITISDTMIQDTRKDAVKTRVPGTWGDNVRYLWTAKADIIEIHDGKTMLTFLAPEREYKLYDGNDKVVQVVRGQDLYSRHYDEVEAAVRERYEQLQKKEKGAKKQGKETNDRQHQRQPAQSVGKRR